MRDHNICLYGIWGGDILNRAARTVSSCLGRPVVALHVALLPLVPELTWDPNQPFPKRLLDKRTWIQCKDSSRAQNTVL